MLSGALVLGLTLAGMGCKRSSAQMALPTWTVPALPDTPAGRQVDAYLSIFNEGDEEALRAFIADHFTPVGPGGSDIAARTRSQLRLHKTSRGLNLYEVTESSDAAITVVAQLRLTQEWRRMTFMVESAPPHRIGGIMIVPVDPPAIAGTPPLSDEQARKQIGDYVERLVAADQFSGVVLVAKDGKPFFEGAYGMADRERGIAVRPSTRFSFASIGKMFTAVAVAQLAEAGEVDYDAPIAEYLPEYPADAARRVTIDHLLTHRSGIADYFADLERFREVEGSSDPQRDYLSLFMHEPLRFAPGERFEYSNSNYILLGAIIERVSGRTYEEYLRERVYEPAGMTETSLSAEGADEGLLARGYTALGDDGQLGTGERRLFTALRVGTGSAAGGGVTTARDLLKFDRALRTHALLSPAATEEVLTGRVDYGRPGYQYGYGFILRQAGAERVAGHAGGFPGVAAQFDMYLGSGYTIVVLANYEEVAEPVVMHVQQLLPRT